MVMPRQLIPPFPPPDPTRPGLSGGCQYVASAGEINAGWCQYYPNCDCGVTTTTTMTTTPPPPPPHAPLAPNPPPPPGGTFALCSGGCVATSSVVPSDEDYNWIIYPGQTLHVDANWTAGDIFVQGSLVVDDTASPITLSASRILVEGSGTFQAGTLDQPYTSELTILLRTSDEAPASTGLLEAEGGGAGSPTVTIYGKRISRSWTLLTRPAMPSDTEIEVAHSVGDWEVGDQIAIGGWAPGRGQGTLTHGFLAYPDGNSGLNTFNNAADMLKGDGHPIPAGERAAIVRKFGGSAEEHVVVHCDDTRCCRYDEVSALWDCARPPLPDEMLPCKELRRHVAPTPLGRSAAKPTSA